MLGNLGASSYGSHPRGLELLDILDFFIDNALDEIFVFEGDLLQDLLICIAMVSDSQFM